MRGTEAAPLNIKDEMNGLVEFCHGAYHRRGIPRGLFKPKKWVTRPCDCKEAKRG